MLKTVVAALVLASVAVAGFTGLAQAYSGRDCAMTITKGGCPLPILKPQPGPTLPKPAGK